MSEVRHVTQTDGETVAAHVRAALDVPWSRAKKLCWDGKVHVDGEPARDPAARVRRGATIVVRPDAAREVVPEHTLDPARIVFVDSEVVVVDKPANLQSVPFGADDRDSVVQRLEVALRRLEKRRGPPPRVVHRLDKDTTGLIVFARTRAAERELGQQFRVHSVHRRYLGLAHGQVREQTLRSVIVTNRGDGLRGTWRRSGRAPADGREAITHVSVDARHEVACTSGGRAFVSWVRCRLETGRTHQIRIHLSEDNHPLVGEPVYIRGFADPVVRWPSGITPRVMLHAAELGFVHPGTGADLAFVATEPVDFAAWRDHLGEPLP
jgi:23S rRNA pseudouridine1911/1915/1917 synthase